MGQIDIFKKGREGLFILNSLHERELHILMRENDYIKTVFLNIVKWMRESEVKGKKATVRLDTKWIYAGHTLEILDVSLSKNWGENDTPYLEYSYKLNLVGTKFESQQKYTIISSKDLIIHEL